MSNYLSLSNCIRAIAIDTIEFAGSGHPGMVLGMSDVMTILIFKFLRYNPQDPLWPNRDRLILSAGHGSMLLYAFYYLTNYQNFKLKDLKNFRKLNSKTPGHPEFGIYKAIETTTGPLGQGVANAVGMAIAQKKYQSHLNSQISNHKIYCIVGDGCLMEGITYEASAIAGHLCLNNLIVIFDDNRITIDGKIELTSSEDQILKFRSLGWNTQTIDGHDFDQITNALTKAQKSTKPYFIACKTLIGKGCLNKVNSSNCHGTPIGSEEISFFKKGAGFKDKSFYIPKTLKKIWENAWIRNKIFYEEWYDKYKMLNLQQQKYLNSKYIDSTILEKIPLEKRTDQATRASSGIVINTLMQKESKIICGSADLGISNNIRNNLSNIINKENFQGNYICYGAREHAMGGIMNGLSLSGFIPLGGTFLVFMDYMKPAIRLAALMKQQIIYILTHDSIAVGEDGATHQPIEQIASIRCIPNIIFLRPADLIETIESWKIALKNTTGPSVIALSRQNLPQITIKGLQNKGCYLISEEKNSEIRIFASGSELSIAMEVKVILNKEDIRVKIFSLLSFEVFFKQKKEYIKNILSTKELKIAIEASNDPKWYQIIGNNGIFFGVKKFGASGSAKALYEHYGLEAKKISKQIINRIKK